MAQKALPFILEQVALVGTGNVTLPGTSPTGFFPFSSGCSVGDTVPYIIQDTVVGTYEYGLGTYSAANTLARTTPQSTLISFAGNLCNVYIGDPGPVATSSGASSVGRVPMLNSSGVLDTSFFNLSGYATTASLAAYAPLAGATFTGAVNFNALVTTSSTIGIKGTVAADNAQAGSQGEYLTASVAVGSAVSLTTATATNIVSLSLTAGDWDVWGTIATNPAGTTLVTKIQSAISTTSATLPTTINGSNFTLQLTSSDIPAGVSTVGSCGITRINVSTTTTIYLVASVTFTTSTCGGYGSLFARRVR